MVTKNAPPNKHSLKEYGSLENDSHSIGLIYRPKEHNGSTKAKNELIIAKQRNGMTGSAEQIATKLLTVDDVAGLLSVSKAWVRDHVTRRNPRIPVVRFGSRRAVLRFRPQDIEMFIKSNLLSAEAEHNE